MFILLTYTLHGQLKGSTVRSRDVDRHPDRASAANGGYAGCGRRNLIDECMAAKGRTWLKQQFNCAQPCRLHRSVLGAG